MPEQKKENYGQKAASRLVRKQIVEMDDADIERQCRNSGAQYRVEESQKAIFISYLNRLYKLTLHNAEISLLDSDEDVEMKEQLLIMHYFTSAKVAHFDNKPITFRELSGGSFYFPVFVKRTISPLISHFGENPELLIDATKKLGGRQSTYGDVSVTINAFVHTPVTIVLWQGDNEFPPEGNLLFDYSISDYLSAEDIAILCETITWKLIRQSKN
ncbi:MAG: DUF3786 domain-containing protein [Dehalococcoidia bacterium]|nr:DUF3786 domain-containing protein [Dehalococcoidia bacterium]